ncbi:unnamed protein product [Hymenolepis diminuta]|uniref:Kelch repeat-containing protein n=1 Tax=Hymenolepis diminuta TaxID=6216 RepID=A0A158QG71_HYMDI|nr:unnamed protein product [Hymenolepis diminuta]
MIEERSHFGAVNIPNSGVLVIGGIGRNRLPLRFTDLLTLWSGKGGDGESVKLEWLPFYLMLRELCGDHLATYFQGGVYVVGCGENVNAMEMLDVEAGGQWTFLTSFGLRQRLNNYSMWKKKASKRKLSECGAFVVLKDGSLFSEISYFAPSLIITQFDYLVLINYLCIPLTIPVVQALHKQTSCVLSWPMSHRPGKAGHEALNIVDDITISVSEIKSGNLDEVNSFIQH